MQAAADAAAGGEPAALAMLALLLQASKLPPPPPAQEGDGGAATVGAAASPALQSVRAAAAAVAEACAKTSAQPGRVAAIAAVNSPSQIVVSGHADALDAAIALLRERGIARRAVRLPVSAPFHSPLMAPAAEVLREALGVTHEALGEECAAALRAAPRARGGKSAAGSSAALGAPSRPLISNVTARAEADAREIAALLIRGVIAPVRWAECVASAAAAMEGGAAAAAAAAADGAPGAPKPTYLELGTGTTLTSLIPAMVVSADARAIGTAADVAAAVARREAGRPL
jgi:[acyl-carrier-protein] S-malonyltransferase